MSDDIESMLAELESDAENLDNNPESSGDREPLNKSVSEMSSSFTDSFKSDKTAQIKEVMSSAIPKHLREEVNTLKDTKEQLEDVYKSNISEMKTGTKELVDNVNSRVPNNSIFKNVFNKLSTALGNDDPDGNRHGGRGPTEDEVISENVASVFASERKRRQVDEIIGDMKESKRFGTEMAVLNNILGNTVYANRFNDDITDRYYRKSLELKYKSIYIQKQSLEVTKSGFELFKTQLEALVKNSALPDMVKIRQNELLGETMHARMRENIADAFYSADNPLMRFKNNIVNKAKETATSFTDGLSGANSILEMQNSLASMGGSTASMVGGAAASKVREMAGDKLASFLSKNENSKEIMYAVKSGMLDPAEALNKLADKQFAKGTNTSLTASTLLKGLAGLAGSNTENTKTYSQVDGEEVAYFSHRTDNAIVKTIPSLLSKILTEVEHISTGERKTDYYYDEVSGGLVRTGEIEEKLQARASRALENSAGYNLEAFVSTLGDASQSNITDKQSTDLKKALVSHLIQGGSITPEVLIEDKFLDKLEVSADERAEIVDILTKANAGTKKNLTMFENLTDSIKGTRSNIPILDKQIDEFHKGGQMKYAEEMGLVDYDDVSQTYKINNENYIEILKNSIDGLAKQEVVKDENGKVFNPNIEETTNIFKTPEAEAMKEALKEKYNKTKKDITGSKIYTDTVKSANAIKEEISKTDMYKDATSKIEEFKTTDTYKDIEKTLIKTKGLSKEDVEEFVREALSEKGRTKIKDGAVEQFTKLGDRVKDEWDEFDPEQILNDKLTSEQIDALNKKKEAIVKRVDAVKTGIEDNAIVQETIKTAQTVNNKYNITGKAKEAKDIGLGASYIVRDKVKDIYNDVSKVDLDSVKEMNFQEHITNKAKDAIGGLNGSYIKTKQTIDETSFEDIKNRFNGIKTDIKDILQKNEISVDDLYATYLEHEKSLSGIDFLTWSSNLGFKLDKDTFIKDESNAESRNKIHSIRSTLIDNYEKAVGKVVGESDEEDAKTSKWDKIKSGFAKARGVDKAYREKVSSLFTKGTSTIVSMLKKKQEKENEEKTKKVFGDSDGDGDRDGGWKDRLQNKNKNKDDQKTFVEMEDKPEKEKDGALSGIWNMLKGALPFLGTIAGGVTSLIGGVKGVKGAVTTLGGLLSGAKTLAGGALAAATGAKLFGKNKAGVDADDGDKKDKKKSKKKSKMGKMSKKLSGGKILSTLRAFERKILAKFTGSAGKRILAILTGKIAARLVPVVGVGILAYDAVMIGKDMYQNGTSLLEAASRQILGFNLFGNDTPVDENGNPIKTNQDIEKDRIEKELEKLEKEDKDVNDRIADISDEQPTRKVRSRRRDTYEHALDTIHGRDKFNSSDRGVRGFIRDNYDNFKEYMNTKFGSTGRLINKTENYFKTGEFKNNPSKQDIFDIIDTASERTGVDKNTLKTFAALESGFNPTAKAKTSSAKGLFQFINGTWTSMIKKHGAKYGLDNTTNPYDPMANSLMGAEYIKQNKEILSEVKDNIGVVDLYMAHFLGPYGAKKFFKANPGELAYSILPKAARANQSIFYTKRRQPRTVSEVYNYMQSKLMRQSKDFGFRQDIKPDEMRENVMASAKSKLETNSADPVEKVESKKETVKPTVEVYSSNASMQNEKLTKAINAKHSTETSVKPKIDKLDVLGKPNEVKKPISDNRMKRIKEEVGGGNIETALTDSLIVHKLQLKEQKAITRKLGEIAKILETKSMGSTTVIEENKEKAKLPDNNKIKNGVTNTPSIKIPKSILNGEKERFIG